MRKHDKACPAEVSWVNCLTDLLLAVAYGDYAEADRLLGAVTEYHPGGDQSVELCTCGYEAERQAAFDRDRTGVQGQRPIRAHVGEGRPA